MRRRHWPVPDQGRWLASVITGHMNYFAVPGNRQAVSSSGTRQPALAARAQAPQPETPAALGPDEPPGETLAAPGPHAAPLIIQPRSLPRADSASVED